MTAQFDGKFYWAKDLAGHGGSKYKVYEKRGKKLAWVADADEYGDWIASKHKGDIGLEIDL